MEIRSIVGIGYGPTLTNGSIELLINDAQIKLDLSSDDLAELHALAARIFGDRQVKLARSINSAALPALIDGREL